MRLPALLNRFRNWLFWRPVRSEPARPTRGAIDHVVILDGTMSSLDPGDETNAGLTYKLLTEAGHPVSVYYEPGLHAEHWRNMTDVMTGKGINLQIRRAYGYLASRYRAGDRIFLMGYSRGAYAARSVAGMIDSVGLVRRRHATERTIRAAYRHYQFAAGSAAAAAFREAHCHPEATVEMVGVWDTVKALGVRLPLVWRLTEKHHAFHNHALSPVVRNGFQALAINETREAYDPVLWDCPEDWAEGRIEQVWFRGSHGDVGGELAGFEEARPLSNIPLVWMLERLESCGVALPEGWAARYPTDAAAPSSGTWRRWGKFFLLRRRRVITPGACQSLHASVPDALRAKIVARGAKRAGQKPGAAVET
ncbi:DUF2235 domain-containing protein [Poseidonocella sedimentorum]|uniref:Uncharacterized alpha/beta hydrolase domain n=1 Tax=Poseidonocella sedimentorum TaxID=871652 RepID=A0A1I6DHY5_9RHOB|nr:DUF2235 domain-containing protein [Poseidonocella sedimentorum]SFR05036.1 Uncharacterized alpha/beta hydrolase domain [Poseidonocella sedimentorum]